MLSAVAVLALAGLARAQQPAPVVVYQQSAPYVQSAPVVVHQSAPLVLGGGGSSYQSAPVYMQSPPMSVSSIPSYQAVSAQGCACGGAPPSCGIHVSCQVCKAEPPVCKDIPCTITPPEAPADKETVCRYYDYEKEGKTTIQAARIVKCKEQTFEFGEKNLKFDCGTITVCIRTKECWSTSSRCETYARPNTAIRINRIRGTSQFDLYALNVPGLPTEVVLMRNAFESEIRQRYPDVAVDFPR